MDTEMAVLLKRVKTSEACVRSDIEKWMDRSLHFILRPYLVSIGLEIQPYVISASGNQTYRILRNSDFISAVSLGDRHISMDIGVISPTECDALSYIVSSPGGDYRVV